MILSSSSIIRLFLIITEYCVNSQLFCNKQQQIEIAQFSKWPAMIIVIIKFNFFKI